MATEIPVYDFCDLISKDEEMLCNFIYDNVGYLTQTLVTAKQWLLDDPRGEDLINHVGEKKRAYALNRSSYLGVSPGQFLIDSVRRLHYDISTVLFLWTMSDTPCNLAENLIWDQNGMRALETIRVLHHGQKLM